MRILCGYGPVISRIPVNANQEVKGIFLLWIRLNLSRGLNLSKVFSKFTANHEFAQR